MGTGWCRHTGNRIWFNRWARGDFVAALTTELGAGIKLIAALNASRSNGSDGYRFRDFNLGAATAAEPGVVRKRITAFIAVHVY